MMGKISILSLLAIAGIAGEATSQRIAPATAGHHHASALDRVEAHLASARGPAAYHALRAAHGIAGPRPIATATATTTVPAPKQKWRLSVGCHHWGPGCWMPGFQGTDSSPTLGPDGYVVIASYNSNVYSVHADTGAVRWTSAGGGESSPFITRDNKVLIPSYSALLKLDGATGKKEWSWAPTTWDGSIASAGAIDDDLGLVFAGALDDNFYAVDLATGKTRWTYKAGGEIWSSLGSLNLASKGLVCFGVGGSAIPSSDCHAAVHCVRKADGARAWVGRTGKQIQSRPAFGNHTNAVFVGDYDNCVYAFNADTGGKPLWKTCTAGRVESSPAVFFDEANNTEIVTVGSGDGYLYGFDGATGAVLWKARCNGAVGLSSGGVLSSPWIHADSGTVFVGGGGVTAVDVRTGAVKWHFAPAGDAKAQFGASPYVTADGATLYEGGEDGYLYALDLSAVAMKEGRPRKAPVAAAMM